MGPTVPHATFSRKERRAPYLVRLIKPNLIASHDWHVQPICQRSMRLIRLSGALGSKTLTVTPGCPRTFCAGPFRFTQRQGRFGANFSRLSDFNLSVKPVRAARNLNQQHTQKAPSHQGSRENFPGLAMACSWWGPLNGALSGTLPNLPGTLPNYPTNQLPIVLERAGLTGHQEAPLLISNSPRVAHAALGCKPEASDENQPLPT